MAFSTFNAVSLPVQNSGSEMVFKGIASREDASHLIPGSDLGRGGEIQLLRNPYPAVCRNNRRTGARCLDTFTFYSTKRVGLVRKIPTRD